MYRVKMKLLQKKTDSRFIYDDNNTEKNGKYYT